uniref:Uncharacterized protein n=1 Tax=Anguilla anguilla TaxID=7936 RepID=A0A0E9S0E2_ANGAN
MLLVTHKDNNWQF